MDKNLSKELADKMDELQAEKIKFETYLASISNKEYKDIESTYFLYKLADLSLCVEGLTDIVKITNNIK